MNYRAGPGRQILSNVSLTVNPTPASSASSAKARTYTDIGSSTGGPQLLLFERDQHVANLLTSELQLAGYECHKARTAVEVFNAIARYPIRLVLVNLAQAAAARREFWVALDTQRRGCGVQVLTFQCANLGGYGPISEYPEERSHTVPTDIELDGTLGIMHLVHALHIRLTASNTGPSSPPPANRTSFPPLDAQITTPLQTVATHNTSTSEKTLFEGTLPPLPAKTKVPDPPSSLLSTPTTGIPHMPTPNYPEKIHAVIYPNQRSWSISRDNNAGGQFVRPQVSQDIQERNLSARSTQHGSITSPPPDPSEQGQAAQTEAETAFPGEPGLAQLSQMLQQHQSPRQVEVRQEPLEQTWNVAPMSSLPTPTLASMVPSSPQLLSVQPAGTQLITDESPIEQISEHRTKEESHSESTLVGLTHPIVYEQGNQYSTENIPHAQRQDWPPEETPGGITIRAQQETAFPETVKATADNALLLDILQSLPPMSSLPQPQVLSGRAGRSLSNVLLEGHLVPQDRLVVAQKIQRMLCGVDMNYQLGEILLMFKLLTPDQLLAASLVSHGLITKMQISALGHIRQELHSIGLEYDLENLLILFRILTSEQLREVRASWSG